MQLALRSFIPLTVEVLGGWSNTAVDTIKVPSLPVCKVRGLVCFVLPWPTAFSIFVEMQCSNVCVSLQIPGSVTVDIFFLVVYSSRDVPIMGSAYRISAYRCTIACIGIGQIVADTTDYSCACANIADRMQYMRITCTCHQ